jgi:HSP20 family protein
MNDFFQEFPTAVTKTVREDVLHFPPVNIHEDEQSYTLSMAAPGYEKTDFNVEMNDNILTISAEKKAEQKEETSKTIRREFSYKSFKRSFTIDEKIDKDNIQAKYENGVLTLQLPKKMEVAKNNKVISIQ